MAILEVICLQKTYHTEAEDLTVLRELNLNLEQGTAAVICGESGSGKSTLLNLVGGLDRPTSGRILFQGQDIGGGREEELARYRSRCLGFIFQFHYLLKDFTALENVMMPALIADLPRQKARARAEELLERVGLSSRRNHYPVELSGGERQRVAVSRALMNDPLLILADEPTGNLDEANARQVKEILFRLVSDYGKSMILVSHDLELASCGDRHYVLEHGRLAP